MSHFLRWLVVASCCLVGAAQATTLEKLEIPELSGAADLIVRARVTRVASKWTPDGHSIVTVADLEVLETLKGSAQRAVTVSMLGGEVGDIGQAVAGVPRFSVGEEVVVFLYSQIPPVYGVVGWAQGVFEVQRTRTGAWTLQASTGGAALVDPRTGAASLVVPGASPLDALKQQISRALGASR